MKQVIVLAILADMDEAFYASNLAKYQDKRAELVRYILPSPVSVSDNKFRIADDQLTFESSPPIKLTPSELRGLRDLVATYLEATGNSDAPVKEWHQVGPRDDQEEPK